MSKFNTFLAAIGMVFLAFSANAQLSFTFVPSNTSPALGETVFVDVVVDGFTDIASYQYSINWNQNHLSYQGLSNFNLTGLSAGSFGTTQTGNGILTTSWSDPFAGVQSLPDGTVLFTITYDVIATSGVTTDVEFSGTPLGLEVVQDSGGGLTEITNSVTFNNTTLLVDGGGGGGGGNGPGCGTFSGFGMTVTSDSAATGDQVCLDVAVCSFTDIISMQYTMQFDANTLQFDNVNNFNLAGLDAGNFGTTNTGNGFVTVSWFDSLGAGITVPDETVIYSVCFTAIGAGGEIDTVAINGALSPIEVTDANSGGANIGIETIDGEVTITGSSGSAVTLLASQEQGSPGDTVTVDISVRNFDSIVSIQGSMLWDPVIIDFVDVTASGNLPGTVNFNTSSALTDAGKLTFNWNDPGALGVNLGDDVIIYSIRYVITGNVTDISAVDFTDDPTVIEVTQSNNGMVNAVPLAKIPGLVEVIGVGVLTININTVTGCTGDTVCIPVTPQNYNEIVSMQYDINWDTLALTYIGVQNFNLSGMGAGNFNQIPGTNRLRLAWVEPLLDPQTLLDGDTLYEMCFEILAADGASTIVNFDQNETIEFSAGAGATSVSNFIVNDGGVNVDCSTGPQMEVSDTTITNVLCNGEATGAIDVTVINAAGTVTYAWSPNVGSTNNVTGLSAGNYTVTITDANTTIIETYTVTEPGSALTLSSSSNDVGCNGDDDGDATVTPSGGVSPYTYLWDDNSGSTTAMISGLAPGTYNVTVTDANDCTATTSETIAEPAVLSVTLTDDDVSCNGEDDGEITAAPSGGVGPYTYLWDDNSGSTTATISGLAPGTYNVTVTDANDCTITDSETISEPTVLSVSMSSQDVSVNGGSDGTATAAPAGGTSGYTYAWLPGGGTTATISGLTAGTYSVTVTDANGCTIVDQVAVNEPGAVSATISGTDVTCNGDDDGTATVTPAGGVGPYTYTWNPNVGSGATVTGLLAGSYSVTVEDTNNASTIVSITIGGPSAISATVTDDNVSCNGFSDGTATVTPGGGNGGYSYMWTGGGTTATITGLSAGQYDVTVTDSEGCTGEGTTFVSEPNVVTATVTDDNVSCNGFSDGTATVTPGGGNGGYSYMWTGGGTTGTITGLSAGQYDVTVTDSEGCTGEGLTFVSEPTVLTVSGSVSHETAPGANDGAITATPAGGTTAYAYDWSPGGANTASISNLNPGNYTVTVTDGNNCTTEETFTVNSFDAPVITVVNVVNIDCNGDNTGAIDISVVGGLTPYSYNWTGGANTQDLSGITAGNYTITVTDNIGTTAVETITVSEESAIVIVLDGQTNVGCNGESTGAINVSVSGGTPTYSYNWGGGVTAQDPSSLAAGTYVLTVTDGNGCTEIGPTVNITEPAALSVSVISSSNINCNGESTGAIDISVSGGAPAYSYNWGGGITTQDPSGLPAGNYTVTVTDNNGCTVTGPMITLTEPAAISASSTSTNVSCFGASDAAVSVSVAGGVPGYSYTWSPSLPDAPSHSNLGPGSYSVIITDAIGCTTIEGPIVITQPAALSVSNTVINASAANNDGAIDLTVSGGTPSYTYTWSDGSTTEDISGLSSGCYAVTVEDANNCSVVDSIKLGGIIVLTGIETPVSCAGSCDGSIDISVQGGIAPYTYSWAGAGVVGNAEDQTGLCAGNYAVTVGDSNGGFASLTFTIGTPTALTVSNTVILDETGNGCNGSINITITGGTLPYTYDWSHLPGSDNPEDVSNLCKGDYNVTVVDANGCVLISNTLTVLPPPLAVSMSSMIMAECNGDETGEICFSILGGCGPYTTTLNGDQQISVTGEDICYSNLGAGSYTIVIQDSGTPQMVMVYPFTITEPDPIVIDVINISDNTDPTNTNCNGSIDISVSGGTLPYTYQWSNGTNAEDPTELCTSPPSYSVTVTDANDCVEVLVGLEIDLGLSIQLVSSDNVTCFDDCDGSVDIEVFGGQAPYNYIWSEGSTSQDIFGTLCAGTYNVTVTDDNGLTATLLGTTISAPSSALSVTAANINNPTADEANGLIELAISGGWGSYTINWSDGGTGNPRGGLEEGFYTATVIDANGCTEFITIDLVADRLELEFVIMEPSCNGMTDGQIDVIVSGTGSGDYTISWSNGQSGDLAFNLGAGDITVTVSDNNIPGLTITETISLGEPDPLNVELVILPSTGPADGSIQAIVTGGTAPYDYTWSTGESTPIASRLVASTYGVIIADAMGCDTVIQQIEVPVQGECLEARKVISPNNDGKNDELIISCVEGFNNNLKIFNRWGQMVWEADNYDNSWSGTHFDGDLLPESGYFWVLEYDEGGQTKQLKGAFTLLR